jgi:hypothetical protein
MVLIKLASLPAARGYQVPASGETMRYIVNTVQMTLDLSSETRAYLMLQNLGSTSIRYFYVDGGYADGFTVLPYSVVTIVVRETIYLQREIGSGEVCLDRGQG